MQDTLRPNRFVFGVDSPEAETALRQLYAKPIRDGSPVVTTDWATAELVKVAANAFLATKISFINGMAELCETTGADVVELAEALGHDERIGRKFLNSGLGFGGGCLPKDVRALVARADELGARAAVSFLDDVDRINLRRRSRVVELADEMLGGCHGAKVAVLGASFKPMSDDVRDSPALDVARSLHAAGAQVSVYDPRANENAARVAPELTYFPSVALACADTEIVLHLTEWREFRFIDPHVLGELVGQRRVIDARNKLDPQRWLAAGWDYRALGRTFDGPPPGTGLPVLRASAG